MGEVEVEQRPAPLADAVQHRRHDLAGRQVEIDHVGDPRDHQFQGNRYIPNRIQTGGERH